MNNQFWFGTSGADLGDPIDQSLRFIQANKTCLTKTLSQAGNRRTWTFSTWVKKAPHGTNYRIFTGGNTSGGSTFTSFMLQGDNTIRFYSYNGSSVIHNYISNSRFNDVSGWYHMVLAYDTTNSTAADRIKIYVNGVRVTDWSTETHPSQNYDSYVNNNGDELVVGSYIGGTSNANSDNFIQGYLAETIFIDGSQLAPTDFGKTNDKGIWVNKTYSGSYSGNSFRFVYDSSAGLGDDSSGLGNDFTANNFETTAISTSNEDNDIDYNDTPTNNYAVLNSSLRRSENLNFEQGNLRVQYGGGGSYSGMVGFGMPGSSGKYYWEVTLKEQKEGTLGIVSSDYDFEQGDYQFPNESSGWGWRVSEGARENNNTEVANSHTVPNVGDTIGFLLDTDAGTCTIEINGAAQTANNGAQFTNIPTDKTIYPYFRLGGASGDANLDWNFGQMNFLHEPSGYKHVATNSLDTPTVTNGRDHFDVLTYDGAGGSQTITGLEFQPDFVWIKYRSGSDGHILQNSLRGVNKGVQSGTNAQEFDDSTTITSFNSDGFTVGGNAQTNQSGRDYCAWCWKAGGAPTATNDNAAGSAQDAGSVKVDGSNGSFAHGTIAVKKMSVNTVAGFSMVEYTGTGSAGSIPHGLGKAPEFAFFKRTDGTGDFDVYHVSLGNTKVIKLNSSAAKSADGTAYFNNTSPTSTVFTIGAGGANNTSGENYVAWFWAPIEGFSQFGKYLGHSNSGSNEEGAFIPTGFKPSMIMVKNIDTGGGWTRLDTARNPFNPTKKNLSPANVAEATMDGGIDFLANGFKVRQGGGELGDASLNFVYMAWAENPMGGEDCAPATAR